ncbi:M16 family metallopeptidase [Fodinicurvata sediminis]|uniref:M16 family metallopeptidase n=1 Tax=Fodinicurvata sediminis TaxID=1121832 RepID=UPI0003B64027|nr:pitrilysin family protein [Fodinicurvata sediminis]
MRHFLAPLAIFIALSLALSAKAQVFEPESFTLDNGLQVVVVPNDRAPILTHMIWYRVGSADEPPGKSGIAHFLEHLMFKGTDKIEPGEFSRLVAREGGQDNAYTSYDFTAYFQTIASDRLDMVMELEADRMTGLLLEESEVNPERDVVLEERRSRVDNEPSSQLSEMVSAALYLHHPYGLPIIGWENEIRALDQTDALDFYETWYAPNNAILIVAGDTTVEEVRRLAETHYGDIPQRAVPERQRVEEPRQWASRRVELADPKVGQPSVTIQYLAPSYNTSLEDSTDATPYALQVLDELMGGRTGRLYQELVVEQEIAAGAGAGYRANSLDLSEFSISVTPRNGDDLAKAEEALRAEIDRLLDEGVSEEEVEQARQRLMDSVAYAQDSVSGPAHFIGRALTTGQDLEDIEAWPERIGQVTAEEVEAAAALVFDPDRSVTGVLKSEPTS